MPLPRPLRRRTADGLNRAMRVNGRPVTDKDGAPCCCGGGGGGPCNICFSTQTWIKNGPCFRFPPDASQFGCCDFGATYEWESFWESTDTRTEPGQPTAVYYSRRRQKLRIRHQRESACQQVYRCLSREIFDSETIGGNTTILRNITQCQDQFERSIPQNLALPHRVGGATAAQFSVFGTEAIVYRDGPDAQNCSGSFAQPNGSGGTTTVSWNVNFYSCNSGSFTSTRRVVAQGAVQTVVSNGTYSIVKVDPCFRQCGSNEECSPCTSSLTGPGADSGIPLDPGIAEFLRRQRGCEGCGG